MTINVMQAAAATLLVCTMMSCSKEAVQTSPENTNALSVAEKAMISAAGLNAEWAQKTDEGYLVEGDLLLTTTDLQNMRGNSGPTLIVANSEQYHTTNLVTGLPRAIRIYYGGNSQNISNALDRAITRYNNMTNLRISFVRTNIEENTRIKVRMVSDKDYIASAGFPTNGGDPYHVINFNSAYVGYDAESLVTILAHEMGHCIGFRHTDYMDRSYSCGGRAVNEGDAGIGAIRIPGTPAGPNADSWMLACIGNGVNRPFNANDREALKYLY